MEISYKPGASVCLFGVSLSAHTIKKHQSPHQWFCLHHQEAEWPWKSHTTSLIYSSIEDGVGVADPQAYSHL